uniref:Uncharacterized protein n=1 Tax=Romanomermis culicivorax TaxID=13658 RepID=A0A915K716_ROMCU
MPSAKEEKSKSERFGETNENARRSDLNRLKVLAGLKKGERYETKPDDFEGVVLVQGGFLRYRKGSRPLK